MRHVVDIEVERELQESGQRKDSPTVIPHVVGGPVAVTVILPAYNEAAGLPEVLASLFAVLDDHCEVILVDDGSTDETAAVASRYPCRLLRHKQNYGKGAAVRTGLSRARGRFIIVMDADNTYPAEAVPTMIALSGEYDFVRCVRRDGLDNSPLINRLGSRFFDSALKILHGLEGVDHLSGLYGLQREAFDAMQVTANGFELEIEIGIKAGARQFRSATLPISYGARLGDKKLDAWADGWWILRQIVAMALIHNPGLIFVLPGVLIWSMAAILTFVLSRGSIVTPYVGRLDVNSFIVAALGATIGFQLIVFGIAAALFGVESGAQPGRWLLVLSRGPARFAAGVFGSVLAVVGTVILLVQVGHWLAVGGGDFHETRAIVLAGILASWGVQILLGTLFVSIFAGRLERTHRALVAGELWSEPADQPQLQKEGLNGDLPGSRWRATGQQTADTSPSRRGTTHSGSVP